MSSWGDVPDWAFDSAQSLIQCLKSVDPVTAAHCCRVGELSRKLAEAAGLNEYEQRMAEFSGLFHDIGKIGVSQEIIAKPGKLDPREISLMKEHPVLSEKIIEPLAFHDFFKEILPAIRGHHERVDGQGYPDKLRGDEVPLLARVILIVDTYDAMSETRAYRKGLPVDVVYAELLKFSGTQFDAQLTKIFLQAHPTWSPGQDPETENRLIKRVA